MTEPAKPNNVVAALAAVMRDIPGIGRTEHSDAGYNYRGIESVTREAQDLLGRYGVVFVPRIVEKVCVPLTINNRPWEEWRLTVTYTVRGPSWRAPFTAGPDDPGCADSIEVGPMLGLGRDNSDKGANKAMTQAFKYALIQTLCIGDDAHDADREVAHQADAAPPPALTPQQQLHNRIAALPRDGKDKVRAFLDQQEIPRVPARMTDEQVERVDDFLSVLAESPERPVGAPESAATAEEGSGEPEPESPAPSPAPADPLDAAIARVAAMNDVAVLMELAKFPGTTPPTGKAERRRLLADLLYRRDSGQEAAKAPVASAPPAPEEQPMAPDTLMGALAGMVEPEGHDADPPPPPPRARRKPSR